MNSELTSKLVKCTLLHGPHCARHMDTITPGGINSHLWLFSCCYCDTVFEIDTRFFLGISSYTENLLGKPGVRILG